MQDMNNPNKCEVSTQTPNEQCSRPTLSKIIAPIGGPIWVLYKNMPKPSIKKQSNIEESTASFIESQEDWLKNIALS
jgi:hypothetical protein